MGGNVEAIKERLDIAEVIGGYIKLEKAGVNFKAKCPFHTEKTPSFFVSTKRQGYYCFGCGEKGDIFTFVEKMEGLEFKEALKLLAERAGVELKFEGAGVRKDNSRLYQALEEATKFFEKNLKGEKRAKDYLRSRGVDDESLVRWRLGFALDDWRSLRAHLNTLGFRDEELMKAGLIKTSAEKKDKEPYDVFRNRIIFPIFDSKGEVIAFSGRALSKETEPKYLNSPDTELFNKGETLYGFDKARDDIRKRDYTILVEGQLDLVLSHQAGVANTVASSGTAFTQAHLEKLKKLSPRVLLAFDGDEAGLKAAERSTLIAHLLGMEVKIAKIKEGKDPADLVKEDKESWIKVLKESKPSIEFFIDSILERESDPRKASKILEKKILPLISSMTSRIDREHAVSKVASVLSMSPSVVGELVSKITPIVPKDGGEVERETEVAQAQTYIERIEGEIATIEDLEKGLDKKSEEYKLAERNKKELFINLNIAKLEDERRGLVLKLSKSDDAKTHKAVIDLGRRIDDERRKLL